MLNSCFTTPKNNRPRIPKPTQLKSAPKGTRFEDKAFAAIWSNRAKLGIAELWRCHAARVDGYAKTNEGEIILLEMKETLSWGATEAAGFQFLVGRKLLGVKARRGIIVFGRVSDEWSKTKPHGGLGQLALEVDALKRFLQIGALQVLSNRRILALNQSAP